MSDTSLSSLSSDEERRRPRTYQNREDLFNKYNDYEFMERFRFSKAAVIEILSKIQNNISPQTHRSKSIDAMTQLLVTLRFYATGTFQQLLGDTIQADKSTICRIIQKVTLELCKLAETFIKMPSDEEFRNVVENFYELAGFPRCAGAVDCTHIKIISRGGSLAESFRCRKDFFSINVQVICDAKLKIRDIIARWPGSVHDSTIFNNSHICALLEAGHYGEYFLLGDSGYFCKKYLLTPFVHPTTPMEENYNRAHITTRNTIERCFGVWKRRFPCLYKGITLRKTTTILNVIVATAVLHNIAIEMKEEQPLQDLSVDFDLEEATVEELHSAFQYGEDTSVRTTLVNTVFSG
ncbi:unnamed protein product [Euphydryas editha]|uniref:Putative nuclease HARBI1 n=1 Tax=Euphydryas editha TaxID=104508 RepID=A0AAU9UIB8_EUPED|nr:unnamed protein product [Euphydryas editha]CAH2102137.1 unnamed protein product [Euphydryas editha]